MTDRIREKLAALRAALGNVDDNLPDTVSEFTALGIVKDGVYKNVETAIQACYDICALIVKEEDLGVPSEEAAFPDLLAETSISERATSATARVENECSQPRAATSATARARTFPVLTYRARSATARARTWDHDVSAATGDPVDNSAGSETQRHRRWPYCRLLRQAM